MLALIACIIFVLVAFKVTFPSFGTIYLIALGLAFLAAHLIVPWTPWNKR